ncbi:MAG: AraC family transcriptional regulator [Verrucomicrobiota bacterium]
MSTRLKEGQYFGRPHFSRKEACLVICESRYLPHARIPQHAHDNPYFILTLNGSQEETVGSQKRIYQPSTLAFHGSGEEHAELIGPEGMRCLHVEFGPAWVARNSVISRVLAGGAQFRGGRVAWLGGQVHRELLNDDEATPVATEGLVLELLAEAARLEERSASARPPWILAAAEYIHAQHAQRISLSDVAASVGVHPVQLARAFRERYHCSVGEYIRQVRIETACKAIASGDLPLTQIALAAGFADQAHFSRTFHRLVGMTPGQFRAAGRQSKAKPTVFRRDK